MRVRAWMSQVVIVAEAGDPARRARAIMQSARVHHLPVVDADGHLVGVVSDRDLLLPAWATLGEEVVGGGIPSDLTIGDVMSEIVLTVAPTDKIGPTAKRMLKAKIHAVPVVDDAGAIEGILTTADVVRALLTRMPPEILDDDR